MSKAEIIGIEDVVLAFQQHLYLPDPGIVYVVLATAVANRLAGDPVWLLVVGPPSSGKTEVLDSLVGMEGVHAVSAFTEAGLLSGSSTREGDTRATGGLLMQVGEEGLLVAKDFTTALQEHGSTKNRTFAVLREVFDGRFTRTLGTAGGRVFSWEGKLGFLGAVTEAIDTSDLGLMGERFIYYRLPLATATDNFNACIVANENAGHQREIRRTWSRTVQQFLQALVLPEQLPKLDRDGEERLITLAGLAAQSRSAVVRDGCRRDTIELVPSPERSMRLFGQLRMLHAGLTVIGTPKAETWRLLTQVAMDGVHRDRRRVLESLVASESPLATATVGGRVALPASSVRRHLEDLAALRVIEKVGDAPERWVVTEEVREQWWAAETSGNL